MMFYNYRGRAFILSQPVYFKCPAGVYTLINEHGSVLVCDRMVSFEPHGDPEIHIEVNDLEERVEWDEFMKVYKETQYNIDKVLTLI